MSSRGDSRTDWSFKSVWSCARSWICIYIKKQCSPVDFHGQALRRGHDAIIVNSDDRRLRPQCVCDFQWRGSHGPDRESMRWGFRVVFSAETDLRSRINYGFIGCNKVIGFLLPVWGSYGRDSYVVLQLLHGGTCVIFLRIFAPPAPPRRLKEPKIGCYTL